MLKIIFIVGYLLTTYIVFYPLWNKISLPWGTKIKIKAERKVEDTLQRLTTLNFPPVHVSYNSETRTALVEVKTTEEIQEVYITLHVQPDDYKEFYKKAITTKGFRYTKHVENNLTLNGKKKTYAIFVLNRKLLEEMFAPYPITAIGYNSITGNIQMNEVSPTYLRNNPFLGIQNKTVQHDMLAYAKKEKMRETRK